MPRCRGCCWCVESSLMHINRGCPFGSEASRFGCARCTGSGCLIRQLQLDGYCCRASWRCICLCLCGSVGEWFITGTYRFALEHLLRGSAWSLPEAGSSVDLRWRRSLTRSGDGQHSFKQLTSLEPRGCVECWSVSPQPLRQRCRSMHTRGDQHSAWELFSSSA